jgi:hypothetical protein
MKKLLVVTGLVLSSIMLYGQEKTETFKTKTDTFLSKTGSIIKYVDYAQPFIKSSYSSCETRVRKITNGTNIPLYVYQIVKEGEYGNSTASIEYNDLLEILKALRTLKGEVIVDEQMPNYIENKFVSTDGFQLGYYTDKGKSVWYIKLEKYGNDNTIFIDNVDLIVLALNGAKTKIEEVKK